MLSLIVLLLTPADAPDTLTPPEVFVARTLSAPVDTLTPPPAATPLVVGEPTPQQWHQAWQPVPQVMPTCTGPQCQPQRATWLSLPWRRR